MLLTNICKLFFNKSIWVYHVNSGGCNGCDIELLDVLSPYYDAERFGIKLVASPRHADVMLCQGPAMRSTATAVLRAYEAMPSPKKVIAIGSCACGGGLWYDAYPVLGAIDKLIPVDLYIPGCPPRPEAIIYGIAVLLGIKAKKVKELVSKQPVFPFPRYHPEDLIVEGRFLIYRKREQI